VTDIRRSGFSLCKLKNGPTGKALITFCSGKILG